MIVLFNEQDLVSFGTFMLSEARVKPYLESDLPEEKKTELLGQVTNYDVEAWIKLCQRPVNPPVPEQVPDPTDELFVEPTTEVAV